MIKKSAREVLLYFVSKYKGEWMRVLQAIQERENLPSDDELKEIQAQTKAMYSIVTQDDYPLSLHDCYNPPFLLFYYGNKALFEAPYRLTCVGTRKPSVYQVDTCRKFIMEAETYFKNQLVIVSGMAYGLDQVFMQAAMDCHAPVIAVLGSGIDNPYPAENQGLYDYCKSGHGLVISEYPGMVPPASKNFVFRNRIIASLSPAIFVGGAKHHSGTASTARYGLETGKEILALPCNVTGDDLTNTLIRDGATSILSGADLIKEVEESCRKNFS